MRTRFAFAVLLALPLGLTPAVVSAQPVIAQAQGTDSATPAAPVNKDDQKAQREQQKKEEKAAKADAKPPSRRKRP